LPALFYFQAGILFYLFSVSIPFQPDWFQPGCLL